MEPAPATLRFKVHGMDCAEEVAVLKREVGPVVGGEERLSFDILHGKMTITTGPQEISSDEVLAAVARTGMQAEIWRDDKAALVQATFWQQRGRSLHTAVSGLFLLAASLIHTWLAGDVWAALGSDTAGAIHAVPVVPRLLYGLAILAGVWYVLPKAWVALRQLRPDMNLLMTVAVTGAILIGEWFEAATVSFLFALSLALESWSVGRARRAVEALLDLTPPSVRVQHADGREEQVGPEQVAVGRTSSSGLVNAFRSTAGCCAAPAPSTRPRLPARARRFRKTPATRFTQARSTGKVP